MLTKDYDVELIRTVSDFERVRPRFEVAPVLAFDTETTDLTDLTVWGVPMAAPPAGGQKGLAVYLACEEDCELDFHRDMKPWLETLMSDPNRQWVGHNLAFDMKVLRTNGFRVLPHNIFDTMIASWMLTNDERRHNLREVAYRFLKVDLKKDLMDIREYRESDPKLYWIDMLRYGAGDGIVPLKLRAKMIPALHAEGLVDPAKKLEMPCVHVTTEMETRGLKLDTVHLSALGTRLDAEILDLAAKIKASVGLDFEVGSPVQLSDALFDNPLGLCLTPPPGTERGKPRGTKNVKPGAWPTGDEILKRLDHPVAKDIITFRSKRQLRNLYVTPMLEAVSISPDGRFRVNWKQTGTATGRYSSSPNAQNFPREKNTIRRAIVADDGFEIVCCDYSQIELRLMAHMSRDPVMVDLYSKGADLHRRTAAAALGVPDAEVTKDQRTLAKAINFGFLYGMSARRFKDYAFSDYGVRVTEDDAEKFRSDYFSLYRGIVRYHDEMRDFIEENGYALNFVGERRYLPDHRSKDNYLKWRAWSEGVNFTIQGSAAALMKLAMLRIYRSLYRPYGERVSSRYGRVITLWGSETNLAHEVRMLGQVHDELQFEVRKEVSEAFQPWLKHMMETAATGFLVPIEAEVSHGANLEEAK